MPKRSTNQKGAQRHAEGQHGDKTVEALQQQQQTAGAPDVGHTNDVDVYGVPHPGHHRLEEGREQHDEAEKGSELTKQDRG